MKQTDSINRNKHETEIQLIAISINRNKHEIDRFN